MKKLLSIVFLFQVFLKPPDAKVRAGQEFTISHVRRTVKMLLIACQDPQRKPPPKIDYYGWRNEANTAKFLAPKDAAGCRYDIAGSVILVLP